ncbi:GrdX family protein [Tissierella pigra]|uniref:GrdX protein n=1 Tax=Tissierella pigra TaxID=2607614 RepID=A0A6N7XJ31_9FIRM|nr:GrdX family protein [Tissierella pigra]MBU5426121.1 GrdX family protein [Tissierella pigra]MSU00762.1 GrdX protein [Tissierella pigra]
MSNFIVTNNPYVYEKYKDKMDMIYKEELNYIQLLEFIRDKIHEGHQLLTHPLSGSIKPNETPYKTVMISKDKGSLDTSGMLIVEESIETAKKFQTNKPTPDWVESVLDDFRVIDLSLIENVIDKLGHR